MISMNAKIPPRGPFWGWVGVGSVQKGGKKPGSGVERGKNVKEGKGKNKRKKKTRRVEGL